MEQTGEEPLLDYVMLDIIDQNPNLSEDKLSRVKDTLRHVVTSRVTVSQASRLLLGICEYGRALDKLETILSVGEAPIPFAPRVTDALSLQHRKKTHPWSAYEDQRLIAGIHRFGLDDWTSVSAFVGNGRTRAQCSQRWARGLDPRISKTRWTSEQDDWLLTLVAYFGERRWTSLAKNIRDRCDVQCRYRFRQLQKEPDFAERMEKAKARLASGEGIVLVDEDPKRQKNKPAKEQAAPAQPPMMRMVGMPMPMAMQMPMQMPMPMAMPVQMPIQMPMQMPMQYQPMPMVQFPQDYRPVPRKTRAVVQNANSKVKAEKQETEVKKEEEKTVEKEEETAPAYLISGQNSFALSGQGSFSGWEKFGFPVDDAKQGAPLIDWNAGISPQVSGSVFQSGVKM